MTHDEASRLYIVAQRGRPEAGVPAQLADSTLARRERVIESLRDHLAAHWPAVVDVEAIRARHVQAPDVDDEGPPAWAQARRLAGLRDSTLACELRDLGAFFRWCRKRGLADVRLEPMRVAANGRPTILETARVRTLIDGQTEPMARLSLSLLACLGLRQGEARGLRAEDWDAERRVLTLPNGDRETTKRHGRALPVGPRLAALLDGRPRADAGTLLSWKGRPLVSQITRWCNPTGRSKWADPAHVEPHDLRRWFVNTLDAWQCPPEWADVLAGHVSPSIKRHYVNPTLEQLRVWLARVETEVLGETGARPAAG